MLRIGIIGLGHWGPNLERNFLNFPDTELTAICDLSDDCLNKVQKMNSKVYKTKKAKDLLDKRRIDAVVIATPTNTHYSLAKLALEKGIHVFVEKPLATKSSECERLIELAEKNNLILFVGHVFLYNSAVNTIKKLIDDGVLGRIIHINASRLNLGPVRQDVNALWDLAPHDISIVLELLGRLPESVNCQGLAYLKTDVHDVCSLTMHFEENCMATINVSWLDPNKTRLMTIVGDNKMAVFDDNEQLEKIKIFDKSVDTCAYTNGTYESFQATNRYGDTSIPWLHLVEPLKAECQNFIECVVTNKNPKTDGKNGLDVVRVLEAADISLHNSGGRVVLKDR
ncbi:Gfo/Idh/MocA family protein [Thermodesulfobacteriota bacterium]